MTPLEAQLLELRDFCGTSVIWQVLPGGATIVRVQGEDLPPGWSAPQTEVRFLAPVGYPMARPDCFWADNGLRLAAGAMPQATQINEIPNAGEQGLWFSWHVQHWDPNRDTLLTYLQVIRSRLREAR